MKNPFLEFTKDKKVGLFGIGRSNIALMRLLAEEGREVTLRDEGKIDPTKIPKGLRVSGIYEGEAARQGIDEDILTVSPSVRRERLGLQGKAVTVTSDFEIFLGYCKRPIYLVTGSDGKTTTTTLASRILGCGFPAIGNIGEPMTPHLTDGSSGYVIEASSFMLEYTEPRSRRAVITSFSENHLNWHSSLREYRAAKLRAIARTEEAVISLDSPLFCPRVGKRLFALTAVSDLGKARVKDISAEFYYDVEGGYVRENGRRIFAIADLLRREEYNIKNFISAFALTRGEVSEERAISVIAEFSGLAHRGEIFLRKGGITFINSSIDTTPTRTIATLSGLDGGVILLLGGSDKGLDFSPLGNVISERGDRVIAFGETANKIKAAMPNETVKVCRGLLEAVGEALTLAKENDTVTLSPASASYDEFSDFEERGKAFKRWILEGF